MRVLKILTLFSIVVFVGLGGCVQKGPSLVKVGSEAITQSDLDLLTRVNPRLKPQLATPDGKKKILENFVEQKLFYLESKKRGLHRTDSVKDKLALYRKIIIAQAVLDDELETKVNDYYQNHQDEFERVHLSHISIQFATDSKTKKETKRTEAEALKLINKACERLVKGEDFAKVAKEISDDLRTKDRGGDLGHVTISDRRLERWGWLPLAEKGFTLKVGDLSEPIKTKDSFHVIKAIEEKKLQSFEEAKTGIQFRLQAKIRQDLLESLKKEYKVEYKLLSEKKVPEEAPTKQ